MDKLKGFINNEINQQQSKISTLENTPTDFYILLDMNSNFWSQDDYKKSNEFLTQLRSTFCTLLAYTFGNMVYIYTYDNSQSTLLFPNSESEVKDIQYFNFAKAYQSFLNSIKSYINLKTEHLDKQNNSKLAQAMTKVLCKINQLKVKNEEKLDAKKRNSKIIVFNTTRILKTKMPNLMNCIDQAQKQNIIIDILSFFEEQQLRQYGLNLNYQGQNLESDNMEDLKQISHFTDGVFIQISHTSLNSLEQVTKYIFLRDQLASKILKKPSNIDWLDNLHDFNRYKEEQENSKQRVLINFYQMCCRCENNLEQQGKLCSHCLSYYCDECQQGIQQCVKCNTNFDIY